MKISGRKGSEAKNVYGKKTGGVQPAAPASPATGGGSVSGAQESIATISDRGRLVSEARKMVDSLPDIRVDRVERIQSALDSGTYQVEGEKVADKMVTEAVKEIRNRNR